MTKIHCFRINYNQEIYTVEIDYAKINWVLMAAES